MQILTPNPEPQPQPLWVGNSVGNSDVVGILVFGNVTTLVRWQFTHVPLEDLSLLPSRLLVLLCTVNLAILHGVVFPESSTLEPLSTLRHPSRGKQA